MTGIETTIVTALTNNFIGQMIKSGWEGINKNELLNKDVGQLIREGKYLFLREYTQRYWDRHGMIKVLKMWLFGNCYGSMWGHKSTQSLSGKRFN